MNHARSNGRNSRLRRLDDMATSLAFLVLMVAPLIMAAGRVGRDSAIFQNGEYRLPAPRPNLPVSPADMLAFPWRWDEYWRDIFPFRGGFIHLHADIRYKKLGANDQTALFFDNGYVFSIEEIDYFRGRVGRTDEELRRFLEMVRRKQVFFRNHGIAYYFLLAPSRVGFLRDVLEQSFALPPDHALKVRLAELMPEDMRLYFIFPETVMHRYREQFPDRPLFYNRDNHWNHWGRVVGAASLVEHVRRDHPDLPPLNPLDVPMTEAPEDASFWAYLRLLGINFDAFPPPMTVMITPAWREEYRRLAASERHGLTLAYSSDSFMEILSDASPEILSFASATRLETISIKSPETSKAVLSIRPDILVESIVIDALSSRFYEGYMTNHRKWLDDDTYNKTMTGSGTP